MFCFTLDIRVISLRVLALVRVTKRDKFLRILAPSPLLRFRAVVNKIAKDEMRGHLCRWSSTT